VDGIEEQRKYVAEELSRISILMSRGDNRCCSSRCWGVLALRDEKKKRRERCVLEDGHC
jgi:hypothetical protein